MNVAVLGTGFGSYHALLYKQQPEIDKIIVWGRNKEKLNQIKEKYQVDITTDIEEIFNSSEIDLVDICTPSLTHKEYALRALSSGKHVYCETPVTYSVNDAEEILKASIHNNKSAMVDLFIRFEYPYIFLKNIVDNNKYGALRSFKIYRETPPWWGSMGKKKIVTDLMMHDIDYTTWLLGQPQNINVGSSFPNDNEGVVDISLQYKDTIANVWGSSMMSDCHPFSVGYEAVFEKAVVRYYEDGYTEDKIDTKLIVFTDKEINEIEFGQVSGHEESLKHVIKVIQEREAATNDIKEAIVSLKVALKAHNKIN